MGIASEVSSRSARRHVLVVDDDQQVLLSLKDYLSERLGDAFEICLARNGAEGLASIRRHVPGLVIVDLEMPGTNALELLEHIKAIDRGIPVIVLTGTSDARLPGQTLRQGAAAFAPKPLSLKYMDPLVAMFLGLPEETTERWSPPRS
jgi:DNA-binding NtrC family response regulator